MSNTLLPVQTTATSPGKQIYAPQASSTITSNSVQGATPAPGLSQANAEVQAAFAALTNFQSPGLDASAEEQALAAQQYADLVEEHARATERYDQEALVAIENLKESMVGKPDTPFDDDVREALTAELRKLSEQTEDPSLAAQFGALADGVSSASNSGSSSEHIAKLIAIAADMQAGELEDYLNLAEIYADLASDMANLQKIISENCKSAGDSEMFINGGPIKKEIDRLITKYESYECALFKSEDYAAAEQFCKDVGLPLTCIKTHSDGTFYVVVDTVPLQKMSDLFEGTEDYITLTEYDNLRKTLDTQFEVINSSVLTMQNRSSQMYNQFTIFIAAISSSIEQIYSTLAMYLK